MRFGLLRMVVIGSVCGVGAYAAAGCGSNVTLAGADGDTGGAGGEGGFTFLNVTSSTSSTMPLDDDDTPPPIDDPGCPDPKPPIKDFQCDPYNQGNGDCLADEACYIFVQYPNQPCGQEVYGAYCSPAGPGKQGDGCAGALDCSSGFVCVISGSGNQCIQLCQLKGISGCPPGLICEPIDVEGFGGCL